MVYWLAKSWNFFLFAEESNRIVNGNQLPEQEQKTINGIGYSGISREIQVIVWINHIYYLTT